MSKTISSDLDINPLWERQRLLSQAIEQNWQTLLQRIKVQVSSVIKQLELQLGITGDRVSIETTAQEILHHTIETVLQKADEFDVTRSPLPWILKFAAYKVKEWKRDQLRQRQKVISISELSLTKRVQSQAMTEEETLGMLSHFAQSSDTEMLDYLLSLVDESDRQLLHFVFIEELDGKSLAAKLGITEGAAYTRKNRAITRLKKAYFQDNKGGKLNEF